MPELPEVQTVINYLNKVIDKKLKITSITINCPKILKNSTPDQFHDFLINEKFVDAKRHGKYLMLYFTNKKLVLVHLRMEGKLFYEDTILTDSTVLAKHLHIIINFNNQNYLKYYDTRKFGTFHIYQNIDEKNIPEFKNLGIEPLSKQFTLTYLTKIIKENPKMNVKNSLLDQHFILGIGNIYASEILYQARINPFITLNQISEKQIPLLYNSIIAILEKAIKYNGTTIFSFKISSFHSGQFQDHLKVYGSMGSHKKTCPKCHQEIICKTQNGRSTFYCENCQKNPLKK